MFAIISYFMFSMDDVMKVNQTRQILERLNQKTVNLANSNLTCDSFVYYFPPSIPVLGKAFFYRIHIDIESADDPDTDAWYVIFSLYPRKSDNAIAANSFKTTADVFRGIVVSHGFLDPEPGLAEPDEPSIIDPQAKPTIDALVVIKQVELGKTKLFFIPCSSAEGTCETYVLQLENNQDLKNALTDDFKFDCIANVFAYAQYEGT